MGQLAPLAGEYNFGTNVQIGYFDQQMAMYSSRKTVLDDFWDEFPNLTETEARNALGAFMFTGEDVFKNIDMLSGGEKVRLALCKILKRRPNVLVLDEPTNHICISLVTRNIRKNWIVKRQNPGMIIVKILQR